MDVQLGVLSNGLRNTCARPVLSLRGRCTGGLPFLPSHPHLAGAEVADSREMACPIHVENRVRREVNQALDLKGDRALPLRTNYSLEVMNFARAHLALTERSRR